jgi:hypothetical protein
MAEIPTLSDKSGEIVRRLLEREVSKCNHDIVELLDADGVHLGQLRDTRRRRDNLLRALTETRAINEHHKRLRQAQSEAHSN